MLRAETCHPADLALADVDAWRALCAKRPEFASPLLGPEFARAVGEMRADARVAVWRWDDKPVGFLAYHRRPGGFARPIGAPLSDYHAVVSCGALDMPKALAAAGISAYRFTGLVDPLHAFEAGVATRPEAYVIQLESDAEAYLEALRAASPKRFKNYRRLDHKLDREVGALEIVAPDHSQDAFDRLIAWKREQLARTGVHDFLAPDWTRGLMQVLFQRRDGDFQGLMVNLYAGGRLVAGHFGVRLGGVYHPWIASTDPELAAWSPGQLFLLRAIAAMPDLGLRTYDLGPGHDHYKRPYALAVRTVAEGLIGAATPAGRTAEAAQAVWTLAGADGAGVAGRLRRRLDAIATTELTLAGRAMGLASALAARARRPGGAAEPA